MLRPAPLDTSDASGGYREQHFVDEQQVPDLKEMDEQQAKRSLEQMFTTLSAEKEYALRHEDNAMEMPQSGERIRGPENMRAFQRAFATESNPPSIRVRRVLVREGLWVVEGGRRLRGRKRIQRRAPRRAQGREVVARHPLLRGAFRAPEWRAQWVERI